MAQSRRLLYIVLVTVICLAHSTRGIGGDDLSSKIDADLFLEDEGRGSGSDEDLESSGCGSGGGRPPDDDCEPELPPVKPTPERPGGVPKSEVNQGPKTDKPVQPTTTEGGVLTKNEPQTSFFSQPGILAAIICGAIVGLLCAILLVMFIVYRMRKKDEGSYVLDDSKRTTSSYGKSKEFFA